MDADAAPFAATQFADKAQAREAVWDALAERRLARFPFPPHGRIPNFAGANEAALRLLDAPPLARAKRVKVNPDAPQLPLRTALLERGVEVYMPTPRLRGGFLRLDPQRIPDGERRRAASLSGCRQYAEPVALDALEGFDAIVCGSVAVTSDGRRCGKGEGYSDIEFAILRELGHPVVPVATTVADLQQVGGFPADPLDLPLDWIATPTRDLAVEASREPPSGIDWSRLDEADLEAMPVLRELRDRGAR